MTYPPVVVVENCTHSDHSDGKSTESYERTRIWYAASFVSVEPRIVYRYFRAPSDVTAV